MRGGAGCRRIQVGSARAGVCSWFAWVDVADDFGKSRHGGRVNCRFRSNSYVVFIVLVDNL